ncbi:hypothetical protein K431DRAFT_223882 [Polychaeton citri CBS 116435]|uniref:Tubulin-specific chaperone D C-terminal domain-containing protein n=1 Tax=Polychaeton citri CBS 116435 TaxID=1314669 RepID=A0A9P4Q8V9_9PEZI|nr:hypothetical protein K431DRAFT_223882 [Polychaeton citri CBS 116435]
MESSSEVNDDLKLVKASVGLLADLEAAVPSLLFNNTDIEKTQSVQQDISSQDVDRIVNLIEPFQGEPQLLDTRLKGILPSLTSAFLESLSRDAKSRSNDHDVTGTAICRILYTLCKVRGHKVIVGFFNNEPQNLELILSATERTLGAEVETNDDWQTSYILLLWVSHLLLVPFDLTTFSAEGGEDVVGDLKLRHRLPLVAIRILRVGSKCLQSSTKTQDAAASMLVRLVTRPDMQKLQLADALAERALSDLSSEEAQTASILYQQIGSLRLLAGIVASADLDHIFPGVYRSCIKLIERSRETPLTPNAVVKRILIKIMRNLGVVALRSTTTSEVLLGLLQTTNVLEDIVDYFLQSLGDRDTPVRYASAKSLSQLISELDHDMGLEVIQAILDTFKEDIPKGAGSLDFSTVNALKWHGLTLALGHVLFRRSASPQQLPDILTALVSAINFEQRSATGGTVGSNVRDAANFGIWSVARRYMTAELLLVPSEILAATLSSSSTTPIIQALATHLILSACLDPVGNIRRGSSAALQELVGRHPDQVPSGIPMVQIVDYLAVGLRRRAMFDVANKVIAEQAAYLDPLIDALFGWRGLSSPDVASRDAAAASITRMAAFAGQDKQQQLCERIHRELVGSGSSEIEYRHGLVLTFAYILESVLALWKEDKANRPESLARWVTGAAGDIDSIKIPQQELNGRAIRAELPASAGRLITAISCMVTEAMEDSISDFESLAQFDPAVERLMARHESSVLAVIPQLAIKLLTLKRKMKKPLGCVGAKMLIKKVNTDSSKALMSGAGRAIALGALTPYYSNGLSGDNAALAIKTLAGATDAMNMDWRIVSMSALGHSLGDMQQDIVVDEPILGIISDAIHKGLNDYTIDERGDVGSLVRHEALMSTERLFTLAESKGLQSDSLQLLHGDLVRLSLEKLDKVRLQAGKLRNHVIPFVPSDYELFDITSVSSNQYFSAALQSLSSTRPEWELNEALRGCISCAGIGAEHLLIESRNAISQTFEQCDESHLRYLMTLLSGILQKMLDDGSNTTPALEFLAFLLDAKLPHRLAQDPAFKWRNLLSTVQKSHHKSTDIQRLRAAIHVYAGLADIARIRGEVLKKMFSMIRTNPYPRIRWALAEALFKVTNEKAFKEVDWNQPTTENAATVGQMQNEYIRNE